MSQLYQHSLSCRIVFTWKDEVEPCPSKHCWVSTIHCILKRPPFCCSHSQRQFIHWPKHWQKNGLPVESQAIFPADTSWLSMEQGAPVVHRNPALLWLDWVNKMFCLECVCIVSQRSLSDFSLPPR